MQAPKTLRKPANWQDFESLCKKLWGEIWNCPEIKKNGRNGQSQNGVDIYGIPSGETQYFGVQCKGKSEYSNQQFSEDEITNEIEKAKSFEPSLKKLYLATTAEKDVNIEAFVRKKNLENKEKGYFEVHIFSWEDVVDLIDENRQTLEWYLKNQNFKSRKNIAIAFQDGTTELICEPKFKLRRTHYLSLPAEQHKRWQDGIKMGGRMITFLGGYNESDQINLSYTPFRISISNNGPEAIEEYKLVLTFGGEMQEINDTNIMQNRLMPFFTPRVSKSNTTIYQDSRSVQITPTNPVLVGGDSLVSAEIFLKPFPKESKIAINWKLLSKDYQCNGILTLHVNPEINVVREVLPAEQPFQNDTTKEKIEDYLQDINEKT